MGVGRSANDERLRESTAERDSAKSERGDLEGLIIGQADDLRLLGSGDPVEGMAVKVTDNGSGLRKLKLLNKDRPWICS